MRIFTKIFLIVIFFASFQIVEAGWTKREAGTLAWLRDVYFINENKGWIAGSEGTLLTTVDGGKSWHKTINFTQDNIRQIYFSDENNGWLLCERGAYNNPGANSPSYLLKTSDGGATWDRQNFAGGGRERVAKIFFNEKGVGLAIGESGVVFALLDDKKTWKKTFSPVRYLLLDGAFTDIYHGAIVGAGGTILFTEDAGATWNKASLSNVSEAKLNSVFFINEKNGWTVGANGKIYQTINGGKFWYEQNSKTEENLNDVFFNNTSEGFAIGDEGVILHTTTAGNVWNLEDVKTTHKLEKLFFIGENGWAVGFGGTILSYNAKKDDQNSKKPQFLQRN